MYGIIAMNGLLLIGKSTKWFWIFSDEEFLSQSPLLYIIGAVVVALAAINAIDATTAFTEVSGVEEESGGENESERTLKNMREMDLY